MPPKKAETRNIFPEGLPSPIKDWEAQDTEWFFGHRVKDIERAWLSSAIRGASPNKQANPDRNKRLLRLLSLPKLRLSTARCGSVELSWTHQAMRRSEELFGADQDLNSDACPDALVPFFEWAFLPEARHRTVGVRLVLRVMQSVWPRLGTLEQMDIRQQSAAIAALLSTYDVLNTGVCIALAAREFPAVRAAFESINGFADWLNAYTSPAPGALATQFAMRSLREENEAMTGNRQVSAEPIHDRWAHLKELSGFVLTLSGYAETAMRNSWVEDVRRDILTPIEVTLQVEDLDPVLRNALQQARDIVLLCNAWIASEGPMTNQNASRLRKSLRWAERIHHACASIQEKTTELHQNIKRLAKDPIAKAEELQAALASLKNHDTSSVLQALLSQKPAMLEVPAEPQNDVRPEAPISGANEAAKLSAELEHALELLQIEREKNQRAGEKIKGLQISLQSMESRLALPVITPTADILARVQDPITPEMALTLASATRPLLRVIPGAKSSARKSAGFRHGRKLLELLLGLGGEYAQALSNGQPDGVARAVLGDAYRAQESEGALSSKECRQARTFIVDGEPVLMKQHLAIGIADSPAETLRVHFAWMNGCIVIGHCGEHLPLLATA